MRLGSLLWRLGLAAALQQVPLLRSAALQPHAITQLASFRAMTPHMVSERVEKLEYAIRDLEAAG